MINSPLRRAVLAAAVIASLSIRAAAQSDAAFASALGKIPSGLATMAALKTQSQKPAPVQGPTASEDVWNHAIHNAVHDGKLHIDIKTGLATYTILDDPGAASTDKTMRQMHVVGNFNPDKSSGIDIRAVQFLVLESKLLPETGLVRIDTWIFETSASGQLKKAFFNTVMMATGDADQGEGTTTPFDLTDPKTKARFDEMLKYWAER